MPIPDSVAPLIENFAKNRGDSRNCCAAFPNVIDAR